MFSTLTLNGHPWKTTLVHLERHFLAAVRCGSVSYNGFHAGPADRRFDTDGEVVWGVYTIGPHGYPPWWEATFTDTKLSVRMAGAGPEVLRYEEIHDIGLPRKAHGPHRALWHGADFLFDAGWLLRGDGTHFEVRGGALGRGNRDVYLWHALTCVRYDRARRECSPPAGQ